MASYIIPSTRETVATTITLADSGMKKYRNHYITFNFFDGGGAPVTPSAGTVTVNGSLIGANYFEPFTNNVVDVTAPVQVNGRSPLTSVQAIPAGITGAVTYEMTVASDDGGV